MEQSGRKIRDEVMKRYNEERVGSGGREGLGIYGIQERIAKKKVQLAVKLLRQNEHEASISNIHKITHQIRPAIQGYMPDQFSGKSP